MDRLIHLLLKYRQQSTERLLQREAFYFVKVFCFNGADGET